jgi:hypothetical protein
LFNTTLGVNPYGILSAVIYQRVGSGNWDVVSGTPIPYYSTIVEVGSTSPNVYWEVPAGSEKVSVYRYSNGILSIDNYTNPPSGNPSDPSSLPSNIEVYGNLIQAYTYNKGVKYLRDI